MLGFAPDLKSVQSMLSLGDEILRSRSVRFRSRAHARLRTDVSLGKRGPGICRGDRRTGCLRGAARERFAGSRGRAVFARKPAACAPRNYSPLLCPRSSPRGDLRVLARRSHDAGGAWLLSRTAHHAAATLGMSRHLYHFFDEAGGAHPANFVRVAQAVWDPSRHTRNSGICFSVRGKIGGPDGERLAGLRAGLSGEESSRDRPTGRQWRSRPRIVARLPDDELRAELCALPGVGPKVANCVMLFAYERLRAFPIDVWIERVLRRNIFRAGAG